MDNEQLNYWGQAAANLTGLLKNTLGIVVEPAKMRKIHKAEMKISEEKLQHACKLEEIGIRERARLRRLDTELRRQENLEDIGGRTLDILPETATPECIDVNWLDTFASCAEDVGEDELKNLWANILSGEAQNPGTYSKRTLNDLKNFDVKDCEMCEKLAPYVFKISDEEEEFCGIIWDDEVKEKISCLILNHLEFIGIVNASELGLVYSCKKNNTMTIKYQGYSQKFINNSDKIAEISDLICLTETGKQLMSIINCSHDIEYREKIISITKNSGLTEIVD